MILAYRRGLLTPGYPNGIQSRLRERMLLQSISAELDSEYSWNSSLLAAAIWSPHIEHKTTKKFAKDLSRQLNYAADKRELKDVIFHTQADIDAKFMEQAKEYFAKLRGTGRV